MPEDPKEVSWRDLLEKTVDLGLGAALLTKEALTKLIEDLVRRGSVSKDEGQKMVSEMLEKGKQQKARMEDLVRHMVDRVLAQANLARQSKLEELERRVAELENELRRTRSQEDIPPISECI